MSSPRGLSSNCAKKKGFDGNEEYYRITKVRMKFIKENWIVLISLLYNFKKIFLFVLYAIKLCLLND